MQFFARALTIVAAAAAGASVSMADVIIGNMPGNDGTSTFMNAPLGGANGGSVHDSKAAGFVMPAGDPYTLDFVTLRLAFFDTDSVPMVQLYSNAGTVPGSLIHTLSNPTISVTTDDFVFTPTSTVTLDAGETYWIVVWNDAPVANSFRWMANSPSIVPTGVAINAGYRFSNGGPPPTGNSTTLNSYSVNATIIPAPSGLALLGLGLVALRRRR
jgi:uncharacterized protein (TIGR03382 family)